MNSFKYYLFKMRFGKDLTLKKEETSKVMPRYIKEIVLLDTDTLRQLGYAIRPCILYSERIALNMCRIMSLVYEPQNVQEMFCKAHNAQLLMYNKTCSVMYFKECNLIVLGFAGTHVTSLRDWWVNVTVRYQQEWNDVRDQVMASISKYPRANLAVCGHSKGGAVAVYALQEIQKQYYVCGCYVAGVPDKLIRNVDYQNLYNIKNQRDPVAAFFSDRDRYWNVNIQEPGDLDISKHRINSYIQDCFQLCILNE